MTDHEKGQRDGHTDAMYKLRRMAFGKVTEEYLAGYKIGQEAGKKERADLDALLPNPKRGGK